MITHLLAALLLTQGVQLPQAFPTSNDFQWFNPTGMQPRPNVWAPLAPGSASCIASGAPAGRNAPLTTTRATTATVVVPSPNQTSPGLIPEDSGTVSHVYWNGSALVDTKGNAWTQNGTVPQVPASWYAPPAAGPYSVANNYSGPTTLGEWAGDWQATVVFTESATAARNYLVAKLVSAATAGWGVSTSSGAGSIFVFDGGNKTVNTANSLTTGAPNVLTAGKSGGTCYVRLNGGTAASVACGTMTAAPSESMHIGAYGSAHNNPAATDTIHEIHLSTTPYNDAAVGALQSSILAKIGQPTLKTCAVNEAPVGTAGIEVYAAGTNLVGATASDFGNAAWTKTNATVTADQALALDGTLTADRLTATAGGTQANAFQTLAGAGAAFSSSIVIQAGTQGTAASIGVQTDAVQRTCLNITPTSTPTRYTASTGTAAVTNSLIAVYPSANCGASLPAAGDNILVSMAQHEVSAYPTPFTTGARNATVSSVPLPALHTTNTWCIGITATPGHPWNVTPTQVMFSNYSGVTANALNLSSELGTRFNLTVYDNTGAAKSWLWTHGLGATSTTQRLVACNQGGTLSLRSNGVSVGAVSGAGTGLQSATLTPLQIGSQNGSAHFDGSLRDLRIYPNQTYRSGM